MTHAAIKLGVQVSLCDSDFISLGYVSRNAIAESHDNPVSNVLRKLHTVCIVGAPVYMPTVYQVSFSPSPSPNNLYTHINRYTFPLKI